MIEITPRNLSGEITIVSSKSLSHRYVLAASLAEGTSVIENILDSDDLVATKNALISLGAKISGNKITGSKIHCVNNQIDAFESGSTLRFLIPIAMLQDKSITFNGSNQLPYRTLSVYEELFKDKYEFIRPSDKFLPLTVKGILKNGVYPLRGDISSQFITGLLYALPLVEGDSKIELTTHLESVGYIDLTLDVLNKFGIKINKVNDGYIIFGNQKYQSGNYYVEGDFSGAAFFIAAGLIGRKITLKGLNPKSLQGDKKMIDFVRQMGGKIEELNDGYIVYPSKLKGITIDIGQTPDIGPILMVLGALAEGETVITNASRLRIKESDRLEAMVVNLKRLGAKIEYLSDDSVIIYGNDTFKGNVTVSSYKDHRIAMSMAIASIKCENNIKIDDETVVSKSYPSFFEEFTKLGGIYK
ncbi:3-phosphoshikimate 1-carboxyvinyltransferase [Acholeplasma granularum]|uniref:3-phosphoshikimate 1-carboxyvinyltransferase n=1 Tax=Acholeplasma granularum TaxID=264635 RepID=UPI0004AD5299|nr:3-phosphoshikimate 1-carboxyvinyltransferase [Acholeplasma granularum]